MSPSSPRRRSRAGVAAATLALLGFPAAAQAAPTATTNGTDEAAITFEAAAEEIAIAQNGVGQLTWAVGTGTPSADWNSALIGTQPVPAAGTTLTVLAGDGDDRITLDSAELAAAVVTGGPGADAVVTSGGPDADAFAGQPADAVAGSTRVRLQRTSAVPFTLDVETAEQLVVNALGGDDETAFAPGLAGRIALTVDGGGGADTLAGTDGPDELRGGDGDDTVQAGAGDDLIEGGRGDDTLAGGDGADRFSWADGDGIDQAAGEAGRDTLHVTGSAASESFAVRRDATGARLERTAGGPFAMGLDSEVLALDAAGGDDQLTVAEGADVVVMADGGAGDDTLSGAGGFDWLLGGPGNDTLAGGGGLDALDGADGDDTLGARDGAADLVRCGPGTDTALLDDVSTDPAVDCEAANRPLAALPISGALSVRSSRAKVRKGHAYLPVECPAAATAGCEGTLDLVTDKGMKVKGVRARLVLGTAAYDVAAGSRGTVRVRLVRRYARLAPHRRAKTLTARALMRNAGAPDSTRRVGIVLKRKGARRR